ncbi:unnamed protein product, partial [marine sediment metagenome]
DVFWFRFRRDDIPAGVYEFDPTFGYKLIETMTTHIHNTQSGTKGTAASTGTADNITVNMNDWAEGQKLKCHLYTYGDGTDSALVASTEELTTGCGQDEWVVLTFSDPKPTITKDMVYAITAHGDTSGEYATYGYEVGYIQIGESDTYNDGPETPIDWDTKLDNFVVSIYCSYTEGVVNTAPTITGEIPVNTSTDISVLPALNVTVDDADDDWLNVTWLSNSSNSWVWFARNSSIDGATLPLSIEQTNSNFSVHNTKYWWSVNASDGTTWTNAT